MATKPCTECAHGICTHCDGYGRDGVNKCCYCKGSGKCAVCNGTGREHITTDDD